jgi:hypothetical protein
MGNKKNRGNRPQNPSTPQPSPPPVTAASPGPLSEADKQRAHDEKMAEIQLRREQIVADQADRMARWATIKGVGVALAVALGVVGFGYVTFYLPIQAAHGETTTISVAQNWLAKIDASVYLAWGAAGAMGVGWLKTHRKMIRERAQKDSRNVKLEKHLDSKRTTSGLLPDGSAAPDQPDPESDEQ